MTHSIQTPADIEGMRIAGKLAADCLMMIEEHVKPGISTGELDRICHSYILNVQKAIPAPLNYRGFPKSICTSINHVVCHGIPDDDKKLKLGKWQGIFLFEHRSSSKDRFINLHYIGD